jgi:two-component system sensor histidine kinase MtrB
VRLESLHLAGAIEAVTRPWADEVVRLRLNIPAGLTVWADRARFKRVMANLVSNAIRHGGGDVEIQARRQDGWVAIDVCDHGPGLADDARIFDRFYKDDTSRSREGSGLGLAIARQHALAQGGVLEAGKRPEGGARFTFSLPAVDRSCHREPDPGPGMPYSRSNR